MIANIKSDLFKFAIDAEVDGIAHGCNCFHTMGSGVAVGVRKFTHDQCLVADRQTSYGDINKLGTYSSVNTEHDIEVFNLYTQYVYKGMIAPRTRWPEQLVFISWQAFSDAMMKVLVDHRKKGLHIAIPEIGCGLAGGSVVDLHRTLHQLEGRLEGAFGYSAEDYMITIVSQ